MLHSMTCTVHTLIESCIGARATQHWWLPHSCMYSIWLTEWQVVHWALTSFHVYFIGILYTTWMWCDIPCMHLGWQFHIIKVNLSQKIIHVHSDFKLLSEVNCHFSWSLISVKIYPLWSVKMYPLCWWLKESKLSPKRLLLSKSKLYMF